MKLTRRELAPLTLSIAAACAAPAPPASAQRRTRPGRHAVPPPAPLPRLTGADDIGRLTILGSTPPAPAGMTLLIGHAFPAGALPRGHGLGARIAATGGVVPVQAQVTSGHADGSARLVILALSVPALPAGEHAGIILSRVPPATGRP